MRAAPPGALSASRTPGGFGVIGPSRAPIASQGLRPGRHPALVGAHGAAQAGSRARVTQRGGARSARVGRPNGRGAAPRGWGSIPRRPGGAGPSRGRSSPRTRRPTRGGSVQALVALHAPARALGPAPRRPLLHRARRVPPVCPPPPPVTCHTPVRPSASPATVPKARAACAIPPAGRRRLPPAPVGRGVPAARDPRVPPCRSAGCRTPEDAPRRRGSWAGRCVACRPLSPAPCPLGRRRSSASAPPPHDDAAVAACAEPKVPLCGGIPGRMPRAPP
jgi:hypothetical protein